MPAGIEASVQSHLRCLRWQVAEGRLHDKSAEVRLATVRALAQELGLSGSSSPLQWTLRMLVGDASDGAWKLNSICPTPFTSQDSTLEVAIQAVRLDNRRWILVSSVDLLSGTAEHGSNTEPRLASSNSTTFVELADNLLLRYKFGTIEREKKWCAAP
jgi:hypothetical protein